MTFTHTAPDRVGDEEACWGQAPGVDIVLWPCFLLRRRAGQFSLEDSTHPDSHRSPRQHTLPFPPAARSPRTPWLLPPRPGAHAPIPSGQSLLSPLSTQRGFCCCRSDPGDAATLPLCRDGFAWASSPRRLLPGTSWMTEHLQGTTEPPSPRSINSSRREPVWEAPWRRTQGQADGGIAQASAG